MNVVSFFAGAGGLDLGFEKAGFDVVWANEYDKDIWETYARNHKKTVLDKRSIADIPSSEVPDCDGIIGGPPCQSWSEAGAKRGIADKRGQLFYEFIRILADKKPAFFLAENVSGMLLPAHRQALANIKEMFTEVGYRLSFKLLNVSDFGIPQDRKRVFFVGYREDLGMEFEFPAPTTPNSPREIGVGVSTPREAKPDQVSKSKERQAIWRGMAFRILPREGLTGPPARLTVDHSSAEHGRPNRPPQAAVAAATAKSHPA